MPPQYLSPDAFADELAERGLTVSRQAVHRWAKSGRLQGVITTPGGRIQIPDTELDTIVPPPAEGEAS